MVGTLPYKPSTVPGRPVHNKLDVRGVSSRDGSKQTSGRRTPVSGYTPDRLSARYGRVLTDSVRILQEVFVRHGARLSVPEWDAQVEKFLSYVAWCLDGNTPWYKVIKYKLAAFAASWLDQEEFNNLPVRPSSVPSTDNPKVIFGGKVYRWMRSFSKSNRIKIRSICQSVLQCKAGMPKPGLPLAYLGAVETFESLTTPIPPVPEEVKILAWADWDIAGVNQLPAAPEAFYGHMTRHGVKEQIRRTVREVFANAAPYDPKLSYKVPSTSSAFTWMQQAVTTTSGGNFMHIQDWWRRGNLNDLLWDGPKAIGGSTIHGFTQPEFPERPKLLYNVSTVLAQAKAYRAALRETALLENEQSLVRIVPLVEALKIRPITQADPFLQTSLDSFQKYMHTVLRLHDCFALIGRPVSSDYVEKRLGHRPLAPDEFFCSGDYSAATDGIDPEYTECAIDELNRMEKIDDETYALAYDNLIGNDIMDPEFPDSPPKPQRRGQLMGSITSFPILCLINAALIRYFLEVTYRRVFTLLDAPMMINGDDNLSRARNHHSSEPSLNRSALRLLTELARMWTFKLSPGKTFLSKEVAVINSAMFHYRTVPGGKHGRLVWEQVHYFPMSPFSDGRGRSGPPTNFLNKMLPKEEWTRTEPSVLFARLLRPTDVDLLSYEELELRASIFAGHYDWMIYLLNKHGIHKSHEEVTAFIASYRDEDEKRKAAFGSRLYQDVAIGTFVKECLELSPPGIPRLLYYERIIHHLRPLLSEVRVPWFVPESLGGLGFPVITYHGELDQFCEKLRFGPTPLDLMVASKVVPLIGTSRGPRLVRQETSWRIHDEVMAKVPKKAIMLAEPPVDPTEEWLEMERSSQTFYNVMVFDQFMNSDQPLFLEGESMNAKAAVDHNAHLWQASSYTVLSKKRALTAEQLFAASRLKQYYLAEPFDRSAETNRLLIEETNSELAASDDDFVFPSRQPAVRDLPAHTPQSDPKRKARPPPLSYAPSRAEAVALANQYSGPPSSIPAARPGVRFATDADAAWPPTSIPAASPFRLESPSSA